jgi:hypothetical protein
VPGRPVSSGRGRSQYGDIERVAGNFGSDLPAAEHKRAMADALDFLEIGRDQEHGHDQLRTHLRDFVDAYNFARRLKTLRGLTPYEFICKAWTSEPHRFKINPLQQMPGLNI